MNKIQTTSLCLTIVFVLGGCAATLNDEASVTEKTAALTLPKASVDGTVDSLADEAGLAGAESPRFESVATDVSFGGNNFIQIEPLKWSVRQPSNVAFPRDSFTNDKKVSVSAEKMLLTDFIHYTFGELLRVNYVLGPRVSSEEPADEERVTLSVTQNLGEQELFDLVSQNACSAQCEHQIFRQEFFCF